ncbi:MAG: ATP-binding cassette domain-containing protein [Desulfobacterales bacterium]|nr:ATP-binding cassette domain-containing protein [Desulfobacterales bacterium]MDD4072625.1 ATP-binding cassette domain-containing protein [Desulfobacterales bacterium]MDD4393994.1 ATP-binding cassette domain-containing protein [Desulfobacterales bacterium]
MLSVNHLYKNYGNKKVIEDLSFHIGPAEKVCIFAPSGAGKSTLLEILSGLDPDYKGRFEISARPVATVFQNPSLFWYKTVEENIIYPLRITRTRMDTSIRTLYNEWMETAGLKGFETHYPFEISGGMKQKVSLIRGFLLRPQLILMDEPFSSIDMNSKRAIIDFIRNRYPDTAMMLVTHNLDEIPLVSDNILFFNSTPLSGSRVMRFDAHTDRFTLANSLLGEPFPLQQESPKGV